MLLQLAIHTKAASVVSSVKCIGSRFRLLENFIAEYIKANKMCCGMKVGYMALHACTVY